MAGRLLPGWSAWSLVLPLPLLPLPLRCGWNLLRPSLSLPLLRSLSLPGSVVGLCLTELGASTGRDGRFAVQDGGHGLATRENKLL